jgi:hypothetical protein
MRELKTLHKTIRHRTCLARCKQLGLCKNSLDSYLGRFGRSPGGIISDTEALRSVGTLPSVGHDRLLPF